MGKLLGHMEKNPRWNLVSALSPCQLRKEVGHTPTVSECLGWPVRKRAFQAGPGKCWERNSLQGCEEVSGVGASLWGRQRPPALRASQRELKSDLAGCGHHQILSFPQKSKRTLWPGQCCSDSLWESGSGEQGIGERPCHRGGSTRPSVWLQERGDFIQGVQGTVRLQGSQPWLPTPYSTQEAAEYELSVPA